LANKTGLAVQAYHFPPGISKRPLISHEAVINLITNIKTKSGLKTRATLDTGSYETGKKASDRELDKIKLERVRFHGDWNYVISPNA
jgi:hypothetical protein